MVNGIQKANINDIKVREHDDLDDDDDSDGSEIGGDREQDEPQDPATIKAKMKSKMNDDWNYLKKTLNGNGGNGMKGNYHILHNQLKYEEDDEAIGDKENRF